MKKNILTATALSGILSLAALAGSVTTASAEMKEGSEKCYGVVKAGQNTCGNGKHGCAGHATADSAADEWVSVPAGLCDKLVGGSTAAPAG